MKHYFSTALSILVLLSFASCENRYRKNVAVNPAKTNLSTEASAEKQGVDIAKDAYQVSADEYDEFFASRYGLLYQKFSDTPFTGRIVTVENGPGGKFVIADESWRNGKKDGTSTRWFSNGVKMYERNYSDGKWNGTVTRWWPNGQKMYVRAYSKGMRHGEEATWRSDGTPIKTASNLTEIVPPAESNAAQNESVESDVNPAEVEEPNNNPAIESFPSELSAPSPIVESIPEEPAQPEALPTPVEALSSDLPEIIEPVALPEPVGLPTEVSPELPGLPSADFDTTDEPMPTPSDSDLALPATPESPVAPSDALPTELPGLPELEPQSDGNSELPVLPGLPVESTDPEIPPMSVEDGALPELPGLPPLPESGNGASDDLPPLPPLP
jgi:hypothetical protein